MRAFVDTNVLVYAVDADEPRKREVARALLAERRHELVLSAQVLSEYYSTVTRRLARPVTPQNAAAQVRRLSALPVIPIDAALVGVGIGISREARLSYWDGLILAAASASGCDVLLSEDLSAGSTIAGVRVENPFASFEHG